MLTPVILALSLQAPAALPPAPKPFDCSGSEYRQFDFWVGTWDVVPNPASSVPPASPATSSQGPPASNVVERAHDGCVLVENWDDRSGSTGRSLNIYDRASRRWHQTWVDSSGGLHEYWGELVDGRMLFMGQVPLPANAAFQGRRTVRLSFTPMGPDKVRQLSESLKSDGTWSVNYDLIYTRRAGTK